MNTATSQKNVPSLRFPEFGEKWDRERFGKLNHINPKTEQLPNSFIYIDLESVVDGNLIKEDTIYSQNAPSRAQRVLSTQDVLFQTVRPYQKNNYYFNKSGSYVASTGYAQIRAKASSKFTYQYIHFPKFVAKVIKACTGTSYPAINSNDLSKIFVFYPKPDEQEKIAWFLSAVDKKIEQLTKKKELLEQYKKGMMQKIFEQKTRFKDDNGNNYPDWEEKKLGDVGKFKSGVGFSNTEQGGQNGIPFYKVSDMNIIGNETIMTKSNNYVSKEQIERLKYKPIKKHSIIFAKVGAAIFLERKRIARNFLIDNNMMAFMPEVSINFAKYIFDTIRLSKFAQTGALPSYNGSDLETIKVSLPKSVDEQQKIANFLSAIDDKINLINTELTQVQVFKKGLLQQMFV